MKFTHWKDIAELVGIAAIGGSLVFVGLQMQQTREIALSQAYQARASLASEMILSLGANDRAIDAFAKGIDGEQDSITTSEKLASYYAIMGMVSTIENSFFSINSDTFPGATGCECERA